MAPILGIYASQISGHLFAPSGAYDSIATTTVGAGGASSITFSSIPSTYTHLQVRITAKGNRGIVIENAYLTFNGDSGTNYNAHCPQIFNKELFLKMCEKYNLVNERKYLVQTLYGNEYNIDAQEIRDGKVKNEVKLKEFLKNRIFISTANSFAITKSFSNFAEEYFPNKSKYEL